MNAKKTSLKDETRLFIRKQLDAYSQSLVEARTLYGVADVAQRAMWRAEHFAMGILLDILEKEDDPAALHKRLWEEMKDVL